MLFSEVERNAIYCKYESLFRIFLIITDSFSKWQTCMNKSVFSVKLQTVDLSADAAVAKGRGSLGIDSVWMAN